MPNLHPLAKHPLALRKDYLTVLASMAWADGKVTEDERRKIEGFCELAGLDKAAMGQVIEEACSQNSSTLKRHFESLKNSDLRYTLLTDCAFLSFADGLFSDEEKAEAQKVAQGLGIVGQQLEAIANYVRAVASLGKGVSAEEAKKIGEKEAAELKAAGIPVEEVAIAGAFVACAARGGDGDMMDVLKAFGIGLGVVTGLGPLVMLGILSYKGVKWLFKKL